MIEEVARLRGFDSIAESHAVAPQVAGEATESRVTNDRLLTAMADKLGAQVQIQHTRTGRGKLVVAYNSLDELDGILSHIQ